MNQTKEFESSARLSREESVTTPASFAVFPSKQDYVLAVFLILITTTSVLFNCFVFAASIKTKLFRATSDTFIGIIVITDLVLATAIIPQVIFFRLSGRVWLYRRAACETTAFLRNFCDATKMLCFVAISIDRYLAVRRPLRYTAFRSKRSNLFFSTSLMIFSAAICVPPFFGWGTYDLDSELGVCDIVWQLHTSYLISRFMFTTVLPFAIILFNVVSIYRASKVRNSLLNVLPISAAFSQNITVPITKPANQYRSFARKAIRPLIIIYLSQILLSIPYTLARIAGPENKERPISTLNALTFVSSSTNPILVIFFNNKLKDFLCTACKRRRRNNRNRIYPKSDRVEVSPANTPRGATPADDRTNAVALTVETNSTGIESRKGTTTPNSFTSASKFRFTVQTPSRDIFSIPIQNRVFDTHHLSPVE